jgi:hypothetical protein
VAQLARGHGGVTIVGTADRVPGVRRGGFAMVAAAVSGMVTLGSCAPKPTALERYCDVVHQAEATYDPLSRPGALVDPAVLRKALTERVTTLKAMADAAPDAVRADAAVVRDRVIEVVNVLGTKNYVSASANDDPAIAAVLNDTRFAQATQALSAFNSSRCPS